MKQRMTGWLSQYSGCSQGHGERLMKKIYKVKCQQVKVKMNSGVQELLLSSPCFCGLQVINFRNMLIGNRGVRGLWPLLKYARALKSLSLAGNCIHDDGVLYVIHTIEGENKGADHHKSDVGGLLVLDLSQNPFSQVVAPEIARFYEARKDVLLLGLAKTPVPTARRQHILRQGLQKFANSPPHLMLEAWRLAKAAEFVDFEFFSQCERVVEATHGAEIHEMADLCTNSRKRHQSWDDGFDQWGNFEEDDLDGFDFNEEYVGGKDGFEDDDQELTGFAGLDDDEAEEERAPPSPPPPPTNPFARSPSPTNPGSWAARRRQRNSPLPGRHSPDSRPTVFTADRPHSVLERPNETLYPPPPRPHSVNC